MTTELIAMLGGGASGFLFKLIGTMVTSQQSNVILAHSDEGVTVANEYSKWFGFVKGTSYQTLHGYVILPEIRQTVLAIVGFYFGSSSVK